MMIVSDATDGRECNPPGISPAVLAAAREAFDAEQERARRQADAEAAEQAREDAMAGEPFRREVEPRLGDLAAGFEWGWAANRGSAGVGRETAVYVHRQPANEADYLKVFAYDGEHDRQTIVETVNAADDLRAAVLRTIHRLVTYKPAPRPESQPPTPPGDQPAYPCDAGDGMTLRDRFAIGILPAVYAEDAGFDFRGAARIAYGIADHMLAARAEPPDADQLRDAEYARRTAETEAAR